ncbi:hypothetical protein BKH41_04260 [Helicobacter sp. 12S02232-10]|uniref:NAD-dependent epimerase/dehydratase family protein n=1 Tax=Helicobacter sp. 12S02232-10 TaxID=1476197 RepID=UPI000BA4F82F|nr:NAD(P)-dependent oxidoreductase [Helicobacter sp. 12S02232-10]PAF48848.1 hypothetical protein BKH41_04260 [Helicobacter sp. 12S02232-10]
MKLLITGATGFVGTNFVLKLHQKYNITALLRPHSNQKAIQDYCKIHRYDGNIENLIKLFECENFEGVIHLATLYKSNHSIEDLDAILESNIIFGTQILEALKINPPNFFINTLTFSQFANTTTYTPASLYDASKQAFFDIINFYNQSLPTKFSQLLLYNTYGINDFRPKIFNLWQNNIQNQLPLAMSAGNQKIDISHIDDVINGFDILIQNITNKESFDPSIIYTLENFPRYSLKELANIFENVLAKKLNIIWGANPPRQNEIQEPISSLLSEKFQKLPNWNPQITLEQGIKKTFGEHK